MRTLERAVAPSKRNAARRIDYYYKQVPVSTLPSEDAIAPKDGAKVKAGCNSKRPQPLTKTRRYRGKYFVRWRRERRFIKLLMKCPPNPNTLNKREFTIVRRIYYCIFPRLLSFIQYPPDRADVLELERTYYDYLTIVKYSKRSSRKLVNRLSWRLRNFHPNVRGESPQGRVARSG